jgi:hypothetical protein
MPHSIHTNRLARSSRACRFAIATLVSAVLVAGCGGGSAGPTTSGSSSTSAGPATTAKSSPTTSALPVTGGSGSADPSAGNTAALAFARCMRANGVPSFPDPSPGGDFEFNSSAVSPSSPAFRVAQAKCRRLLPNGGPPGPGSTTHPSAQTLEKLVRIARCMRQHGVPQFPDPATTVPSNPGGVNEITDFDGAILLFPRTIDVQAPAYRQALTACGAPPLGLPH